MKKILIIVVIAMLFMVFAIDAEVEYGELVSGPMIKFVEAEGDPDDPDCPPPPPGDPDPCND